MERDYLGAVLFFYDVTSKTKGIERVKKKDLLLFPSESECVIQNLGGFRF